MTTIINLFKLLSVNGIYLALAKPIYMKAEHLLLMLEINREAIISNSRPALDELQHLEKNLLGNEDNVACRLRIALNHSLVHMLFDANYFKAIENSQNILQQYPDNTEYFKTGFHYRVIGRCQTVTGQFEQAALSLKKAIDLAGLLPANEPKHIQLKGDALYDQAMLNCYSGQPHQQSITLLQQAIDLQQAEEFEVRRAVCLVGLGNVYGNMQHFKDAIVQYHKAADIFEKHSVLNSLGCAFSNIGMCHIMLGHLKQAEQWLNRANTLLSKAGSPGEMAGLYFNYAQLSTEQQDYNATYQNLLSCREYATESGDKAMHRRAVKALHELATQLNDTPSANMFLKELEEVA